MKTEKLIEEYKDAPCSYFIVVQTEGYESIATAVDNSVKASEGGHVELWGSPMGSGGPNFRIAGFRNSELYEWRNR